MTLDEIKELAGHREVSPWVVKLVQDAVELEREACANICEDICRSSSPVSDYHGGIMDGAGDCADAIRSRGL